MKNCTDCAAHDLHLQTVSLTVAACQGKIDECRRLKHVPFKRINVKHDICINCLKHGWATVTVLAGVLERPQDPAGRTIRDSKSSPQEGGVWPGIAVKKGARWKTTALWLALAASALAWAGLLSYVLSQHGPHLR